MWLVPLMSVALLWVNLEAQQQSAEERARTLQAEASAERDAQRRIPLLEAAIGVAASPALYVELGAAYEEAGGRWADARAQYRHAYELVLARRQARAAALLLGQIAHTHLQQNQLPEALKALEAAHALAPNEDKVEATLRDLRLRLTERRLTAAELARGFLAAREYDTAPSLDLYVRFDFDSARLTADGEAQAEELGHALRSPSLASARLEIVGHTDRIGSDDYNQALSERRAAAVRDFLCERFGFAAARFRVSGRGKREPLDVRTNASADAVNRRVQVLLLEH